MKLVIPTAPKGVGRDQFGRTSLAFYRGDVKVFETPLVEKSGVDDPQRRAVVFQFVVPANQFTPGAYTGQVNIIDAVANRRAFPGLAFMVRGPHEPAAQ